MELYIGGFAQGKTEYVSEKWKNAEAQLFLVNCFHDKIREIMKNGENPEEYLEKLLRFEKENPEKTLVIISDEVGNGVVPIDAFERAWREEVGRCLICLAKEAKHVERVICGIGQVLKSVPKTISVTFLRHGKTPANERHAYLGCTEELLSEKGKEELKVLAERQILPKNPVIIVSPMLRCVETAKFLYPNQDFYAIKGLEEMNFGIFEGKNYLDLSGNTEYQYWIDHNGESKIPHGESMEEYKERTVKAFESLNKFFLSLQDGQEVVFVVHGGTIMALLSYLTKKGYYDFQVKNNEGYRVVLEIEQEKIRMKEGTECVTI